MSDERFPFGTICRWHRVGLIGAHIVTGLLMIGILICAIVGKGRAMVWMSAMGWLGVLVALKFCMSMMGAIYHKRMCDANKPAD
jgi:hypothetical protein